jgi:hypothetical protein
LWVNRQRLLAGKPVLGLRQVDISCTTDQENRRLTTLRKDAGRARTRLINQIKHILRRHNLQWEMPTKTFPTQPAIAWLKKLVLPEIDRLEMNHLLIDLEHAQQRMCELEEILAERCGTSEAAKDVRTTMIYTHILNRGGRGVESPLDRHCTRLLPRIIPERYPGPFPKISLIVGTLTIPNLNNYKHLQRALASDIQATSQEDCLLSRTSYKEVRWWRHTSAILEDDHMSNALIVQVVSEIARATEPLCETSPKLAIEALVRSKVEACSEYFGKIVASRFHPFVSAVHAAFCDHRPLVLSPDMFWLLVGQGFARHVNNNSDYLRSRFVKHDGKKIISVRRDDFFKGSPENPWSEVFSDISFQIKQHIGEQNYSNIVTSFSTTGPVERAANEIVLMDSMKNYFEYGLCTFCGIPEVTLEGTAEDWKKLSERTEALGNTCDLTWWTNRLVPTLQRIARNAAGADDPELWNNIYKVNNMSGGPYINGWVVDFFPYLQTIRFIHKKRNELVDDWQALFANWDQYREEETDTRNWLFSNGRNHGINTKSFPGSLCKTPFKWHYLDRDYEMEFVAGFIGFTQDTETLAVRPKIGWAVREVQG